METKVTEQLSQSAELKDLVAALAKARIEMKAPKKSKYHTQYKHHYSTYEDMVAAATEALRNNGLVVLMREKQYEGISYLYYSLHHISDQWIGGWSTIGNHTSDADHRKALGWKMTDAYSLLIGVEDLVGEDEDKQYKQEYKQHEQKQKLPEQKVFIEKVSKDQIDLLERELDDYPKVAEKLFNQLKINSYNEIPKDKFMAALEWIRKLIRAENETK